MASRPARIPAVRRGYLVAVVVTTGSAVKVDLAYLAHAVRLGRVPQPFQWTDYRLGGRAAGGPHQRREPPSAGLSAGVLAFGPLAPFRAPAPMAFASPPSPAALPFRPPAARAASEAVPSFPPRASEQHESPRAEAAAVPRIRAGGSSN